MLQHYRLVNDLLQLTELPDNSLLVVGINLAHVKHRRQPDGNQAEREKMPSSARALIHPIAECVCRVDKS